MSNTRHLLSVLAAAISRWRRVLVLASALVIFTLLSPWSASSSSHPSTTALRNLLTSAGSRNVDGLREYRKGGDVTFSSLDIHHPFSPLCTERQQLLDAMSGGGRLGFDEPYWAHGCDMQWFSIAEICDILSRFDNIYLVGDSMIRHLAQSLQALQRGDLVDGGRVTWVDDYEVKCHGHRLFNDPGCVWVSAINTVDVLKGDPASIKCPANKPVGLISWTPALAFPLSEPMTYAFGESIVNKDNPTGRDVFIMGHGLWNNVEIEMTMSWLEQLEDVLQRTIPAFFKPDLDPDLFPRLYILPSAQGEGKPDVFVPWQNNIRLMRHGRAMKQFTKELGYEYLALYNLTVQASSPDGCHMTYENNLMKGMMVLNWLNMLKPQPSTSNSRGELPEAPADRTGFTAPWNLPAAPPVVEEDYTHENTPFEMNVPTVPHPIDELVARADKFQAATLEKGAMGVEGAAAAYRGRRGRHPPPGFDKWVKFASEKGALIVEDFFDQIYLDTDAFWGVPTDVMRAFPASWMYTLSIRNGTMRRWADEPPNIALWMDFWEAGLSGLPLEDLPDVDLAFNGEDEVKMFVPWEVKNAHFTDGQKSKHTDAPTASQPILNDFSTYAPLPRNRTKPGKGFLFDDYPEDDPLWPLAAEACPPTSPGRKAQVTEDLSVPAQFPNGSMSYMEAGYIANWTDAKSPCAHPEFRDIHGTFIGMLSHYPENIKEHQKVIIKRMVPLLSGCKVHDVNSEILVPPALQWPSIFAAKDTGFSFQESSRVPWDKKRDSFFWRGSASGGVNTKDDWTRFQRHRFVAMQNGTLVAAHERVANQPLPAHVPGGDPVLPHNFPLPDPSVYPLAALKNNVDAPNALGTWVDSLTDAAFIHLRCFPPPSWFSGNGQDCPYNGEFYNVKGYVTLSDMWKHKYQPDVDGASYSGRYRAILESNSLPMKSTIYDEWHDSRLVPWKHFVPMDVGNADWWGLMEYFAGYPGQVGSHDDVARGIAESGRDWAKTVLRTEDMLVYMYRLILELARLSDDRREQMGFVDDLV